MAGMAHYRFCLKRNRIYICLVVIHCLTFKQLNIKLLKELLQWNEAVFVTGIQKP